MNQGVGFATARAAALQSLYFRIQNQAFMLSFNQLVYIIMIIFALAFIPLYLIKFTKKIEIVDSH